MIALRHENGKILSWSHSSATLHNFYHTYLTIRKWLQNGISPSAWWLHYGIEMARYDLSHSWGTYRPCKLVLAGASIVAHSSKNKRTLTRLTETLNWFIQWHCVFPSSLFYCNILHLVHPEYNCRHEYTRLMRLFPHVWPFCEWNRNVVHGFPSQRQITCARNFDVSEVSAGTKVKKQKKPKNTNDRISET